MAAKSELATGTAMTPIDHKAVAGYKATGGSVTVGGVTYEVAQQVTVPILKFDDGETIIVKPVLAIAEEEQTDPKTGEVKPGKINVVRVEEQTSGQLFAVVLGAIAAGELRDAFPDHGYVNRVFAIRKVGKVAGKQYKEYQIVELKPKLS